jgi:hypothetical protein
VGALREELSNGESICPAMEFQEGEHAHSKLWSPCEDVSSEDVSVCKDLYRSGEEAVRQAELYRIYQLKG